MYFFSIKKVKNYCLLKDKMTEGYQVEMNEMKLSHLKDHF